MPYVEIDHALLIFHVMSEHLKNVHGELEEFQLSMDILYLLTSFVSVKHAEACKNMCSEVCWWDEPNMEPEQQQQQPCQQSCSNDDDMEVLVEHYWMMK